MSSAVLFSGEGQREARSLLDQRWDCWAYYQKQAIGSIFDQFSEAREGTSGHGDRNRKTRTAIALVDALQKAGWVKRALFLADRISLVNQAANAFKTHLPDSSPVNLVSEKDKGGEVYVCTYPTMMGLIESQGRWSALRVGHFDLIIIDEAHRSRLPKISGHFQLLWLILVGLTATPRDQVDKNTYELFDLEPGVPTDAYELDTAVKDGFLVPPKLNKSTLDFHGRYRLWFFNRRRKRAVGEPWLGNYWTRNSSRKGKCCCNQFMAF